MKIVIAADSFKGCLTSREVAQHMEIGIHRHDESIEVQKFLVGDGGEGTMDAFVDASHGMYVEVRAHDAYRKWIKTRYGLIDEGRTAIIEVGSVIGLSMVEKDRRAPMYASSYGVGEMLLHAKKRGCKKIILALGGSSTNDGGMGLLEALGVKFYDEENHLLQGMAYNLEKIDTIDFSGMKNFEGIECIAACDVKNHLLGENGATHIFGKQKGLYPNQIKRVERGMKHYCEKMKQYDIDLDVYEGGGAAGGIGAVFIALLQARMQSGIALLFAYNQMEEVIANCDLVITGEGQSDRQTLFGKVPVGVLNIANKYDKPCICISGALGLEYNKLYDLGFVGIFSIADRAMSFAQALASADDKLEACTYSVIKTITYFMNR